MATTFAIIPSTYILRPEDRLHSDSDVALTSFYGGILNDRSLQLTVGDVESHKYTLLKTEDVRKLRDELNNWLERKELTEVSR